MKSIIEQRKEIWNLHKKYEKYLSLEYGDRDYHLYLSNPDNFKNNVYYHQANSVKDRDNILNNGFKLNKVKPTNCGAGRGLYLSRDKRAIINFYSESLDNAQDLTLKIEGSFNFLDILDNRYLLQTPYLLDKMLANKYDGLRYYDPDATGEEFVLFNPRKVKKWSI